MEGQGREARSFVATRGRVKELLNDLDFLARPIALSSETQPLSLSGAFGWLTRSWKPETNHAC